MPVIFTPHLRVSQRDVDPCDEVGEAVAAVELEDVLGERAVGALPGEELHVVELPHVGQGPLRRVPVEGVRPRERVVQLLKLLLLGGGQVAWKVTKGSRLR